MKVIKQYILNIYEDGTISTEEIVNHSNLNKDVEIKEVAIVTRSWEKYNLISYPKKSKLYEEIQSIESDYIKIVFLSRSFEGKIDRKNARIYGLKDLMNFSRIEQVNFKEGQNVSLEFDKVDKVLKIKQI